MCDLSGGCECWGAVTRAFRELKGRGVPDTAAFNAATRVYQFYHPEVSAVDARFTVAEWVDESNVFEA
jgi:hypothetical protein